LAESEARYKSILDSSDTPICRWIPDTTLTYVNEAYARLYKAHGNNLEGRRWIEFIPEERRQSYEIIVSDMTRRGEEEITLDVTLDAAGNEIHLAWRDVPVLNKRREVIEFHSIAHDITELVNLRRAARDFDASKDALLTLTDQPVLIFDGKGAFLEMNPAFRSLISQSHGWNHLSDAISRKALGTLQRLLRRVTFKEEVCFQVMIEDAVFLMKIRRLSRDGDETHYMAVFESLQKGLENPVLKVRLRNEEVIEGDRREFISDGGLSTEIEQRMETLGKTVRADRIYVFTFDNSESVFNNVLEWCAEGITPHLDDLQGIPMSEYPWWMQRMNKHQWIIVEDTSRMPRGAARESEILMAQDICSVMSAPLVIDGEAVGFVGIDYNHSTRLWHEQEKKELDSFKCRVEAVLAGKG
jgi:PAS domain S-box-containing protein